MGARKPIIGIRIIKTCLSVLAIYLLALIFHYPTPPIYAYLACIMGMKDSVEHTIDYGIKRTISTMTGGVVALAALQILTLFSGTADLVVRAVLYPAGVGAILFISSRYGLGDISALGATIYLIAIIGYSGAGVFIYVLVRTMETIAGIVIAVLINRYFMPKRSTWERETFSEDQQS